MSDYDERCGWCDELYQQTGPDAGVPVCGCETYYDAEFDAALIANTCEDAVAIARRRTWAWIEQRRVVSAAD